VALYKSGGGRGTRAWRLSRPRATKVGADIQFEAVLGKTHCTEVRPEKADVFSGGQSHRGKSQEPRSWTAGRRETETLKPVDKPICGMGSESLGRNESERTGGLERGKLRRAEPASVGQKAAWSVAAWLTRRATPAG